MFATILTFLNVIPINDHTSPVPPGTWSPLSFLQLPHGDEGRGRLVSHNARYDDDDGVDRNHDRHDEIQSTKLALNLTQKTFNI